jgi:hypothetical protein
MIAPHSRCHGGSRPGHVQRGRPGSGAVPDGVVHGSNLHVEHGEHVRRHTQGDTVTIRMHTHIALARSA